MKELRKVRVTQTLTLETVVEVYAVDDAEAEALARKEADDMCGLDWGGGHQQRIVEVMT